MRGQNIAAAALAAGVMGAWPAVAGAQVTEESTEEIRIPVAAVTGTIGPTRLWSVDVGNTLAPGETLLSTAFTIGSTGLAPVFPGAPGVSVGLVGNGANVRAEAGIRDGFEMGGGFGVAGGVPWRGRLDLYGKWNLMREGDRGAWFTIGSVAGGLLEMDASGTPNLGVQFGIPVTKAFPFTRTNFATVTWSPNLNMGIAGEGPGVQQLSGFSFLGMGLGLDLALTERTHLIADTNLGMKLGGVTADSAIGVRYAFNPSAVGAIYLGVGTGGPGAGVSGLGIGASMRM